MSDNTVSRRSALDLRSPVGLHLLRTLDATAARQSREPPGAVVVLGLLLATPLSLLVVALWGGWPMLRNGASVVWSALRVVAS